MTKYVNFVEDMYELLTADIGECMLAICNKMFHTYCQRQCVCRRQMQFVVANNELNDNCLLTTILPWVDPKNIIIKAFLKA